MEIFNIVVGFGWKDTKLSLWNSFWILHKKGFLLENYSYKMRPHKYKIKNRKEGDYLFIFIFKHFYKRVMGVWDFDLLAKWKLVIQIIKWSTNTLKKQYSLKCVCSYEFYYVVLLKKKNYIKNVCMYVETSIVAKSYCSNKVLKKISSQLLRPEVEHKRI